jgi:hypothetical protein
MKNIFFALIFAIFLTSCTEEIKIDLNSSNPALVVEAKITNEAGPYTVKLSKSVNYDAPNTFPAATGATVIISDDAGNRDTLTEGTGGIYTTKKIQGIEGRTYNLFIKDGEKEYTAASKMENMVTLDSIYSLSFGGGPGPGGPGKDSNLLVFNIFQDPAAVKNYYRIQQYIKKPSETDYTRQTGIVALDDLQTNGNMILIPYFGQSDVRKNDSVIMELQTLNKAAYDYLNTLSNINGGGFSSGTPANPTSNISGGAMGYFSAHTISRLKIQAK